MNLSNFGAYIFTFKKERVNIKVKSMAVLMKKGRAILFQWGKSAHKYQWANPSMVNLERLKKIKVSR